MVDSATLEMLCTFTGTTGSNPVASANKLGVQLKYFF